MFIVRTSRMAAIAMVAIAAFSAQLSYAQDPASSSVSTKVARKEPRKANRKAVRAKNASEIKTLEKNGYHPGGDQEKYPENLQNAEEKAKAAAGGVSAPKASSVP
jgi:hypothetical protein